MKKLVLSTFFTAFSLMFCMSCGSEKSETNSTSNKEQNGQNTGNTGNSNQGNTNPNPTGNNSGNQPLPKDANTNVTGNSLVGSYAGFHLNSTQVKNPLSGQWSKSSSRAWIFHKIESKDGKIISSNHTCKLEQDETMGIQNTFSQKFVDAMPQTIQEVRVDGGKISFSRVVSVLGANLRNPLIDSLPKDATDPRIQDSDKDSKPGVTINIVAKSGLMKTMLTGGGELYLTQKIFDEKIASQDSKGNIRGYQKGSTDMSVIGAKPSIMNRQVDSKPDADPNKNQFIMKKIQNAQSCADVAKLGADFFK